MTSAVLTPAARRHVVKMIGAIGLAAGRLDRQFISLLKGRPYDTEQIRAFLAITPAAAARTARLDRFLRQVGHQGRRLARWNLPPAEVEEVLREFGDLLDRELGGRFQPAREQLQLATSLTLNDAFYQVREAESQAFFGIYRAQVEAGNLQDLLRRFVRILTQTFHARAGRLVLQPPAGKLSRPIYVERGKSAERLIADEQMRGRYASYWSFPLPPVGVVQFGFAAASRWLPRDLALLESAAGRCRDSVERARMEREIRRLDAQSRRAGEQERHRIGRELHDEAGQSLLLLRLQLEMLERDAPAQLRPRLAEARGITEKTVTELRRLIAALSPSVLERLGLERALHQLAARFRQIHSARLRLTISPGAALAPQMQDVIYRVAQESLQNIARHSGAERVNLSLRAADKWIRLSVTDDGAGFLTETAVKKPMSFGLAGMRERAGLLGGTLALRSAPGKGTSVVLQLPKPVLEAPHGEDSRISD